MLSDEDIALLDEFTKKCDHLDEDLVQVHEYLDSFAWYCKKCHITFSRYTLQPLREYQQLKKKGEP